MTLPKEDFTTSDKIIGNILMLYPALDESFYQDGQMEILRIHDQRNDLSQENCLAGLPKEFNDQLETMRAAAQYTKESLAAGPTEIKYSDADTLHMTIRIAAENLENRSQNEATRWIDYLGPTEVVKRTLANLLRRAESAKLVINEEMCQPTDAFSAHACASNLYDTILREAGVVPPTEPITQR